MSSWTDQVHRRAELVHDQIAAAMQAAVTLNVPAEDLLAPYRALLNRLYLDDLPYARLLDYSDLVVRAEGSATETYEPRVSALTHLLDRLREESRRIAKAVGGIREDERVDNLDLLLSGLARGSLIVGLKLAPPTRHAKQLSLITEDEPVFQAVRAAMQALAKIPHLLTDTGVNEDIANVLPDPAVRDAALVTMQRLAPTGRGGIDRVALSSPGMLAGVLTAHHRGVLRQAVAAPQLRAPQRGTFQGLVREVDLDAKRLEIRHVPQVGAIRCVVQNLDGERARRWMDRYVKVTGLFEKDSEGRPRLLRADKVSLLKTPRQPGLKGIKKS